MAQIGRKKNKVEDRAHNETVAHQHVPGRAYDVQNPLDRLIHVIGGGFFSEPRYYDSNRSAADFAQELAKGNRISSTVVDEMGLTEQAKEVIETMTEVAKGEYEGAEPDDLLVVASWARDAREGLKLRTTPQIALTVAAANAATRTQIKKYGPQIMQRPDDVTQVFAGFRHLYSRKDGNLHKGGLPHQLRRSMELSISRFSEYQILKYSGGESRPNMADVLKMLNGKSGYPLSNGMFEYVVNGKITEGAPAVLQARKEFFALEQFENCTPELVKNAQLTWENVLSKFGGGEEGTRAEVWEMIIPHMNEMALVRNLRNFENAGISKDAWQLVKNKLEGINTKQLPFRFFTAARETISNEAQTIVAGMLDDACEALPKLKGVTAVFVDNSGSAVGCATSGNSNMRVSDAGNTLAAVAAKSLGDNALVGVFGDSFMWVPHAENDSALQIKAKIEKYAQSDERSAHGALSVDNRLFASGRGVGGGTETGLWFGIDDITQREVHVDRIVMLSDLCCYTQGDTNCTVDMTRYFGENATVQGMVDKYRAKVNKDCRVYSINLNGHGQAQARDEAMSHRLSGWSEQIFKTISDIEGGGIQDQGQQNQNPEVVVQADIPTIDALRLRYRVNIDK